MTDLRTIAADLLDARPTPRGDQLKARCPFHLDTDPSLLVGEHHFHCFGCGAHGNPVTFWSLWTGLPYSAAGRELAARYGAASGGPDSELLAAAERLTAYYSTQLEDSPQALAYLQARGISETTIRRARLGYAPEKPCTDSSLTIERLRDLGVYTNVRLLRNAIVFPICDLAGRPRGFAARNLRPDGPKYVNSATVGTFFRKDHFLYGLERPTDRLVLVEGFFDQLRLTQRGVAAAALMGTHLSPQQARLLPRDATIVLALDGDAAGASAASRALPILLRERLSVRLCQLPPGLDPADLADLDDFHRALAEAPDALAAAFRQIAALTDSVQQLEHARVLLLSLRDPLARDRAAQEAARLLGCSLATLFRQDDIDPLNTFQLVGDLLRDPDIRLREGRPSRAAFYLQINTHRGPKNCTVFAFRSDLLEGARLLHAGSRISVLGYLEPNRYTPNGSSEERFSLDPVATQVMPL